MPTDVAEPAKEPHIATLPEVGDNAIAQSAVSTQDQGTLNQTRASIHPLGPFIASLDNDACTSLSVVSTSSSVTGPNPAATQSSRPEASTAPTSRPPKPKKTENRLESIDHVAFAGLLQQATSPISEGTQDAVTKLREIAKGETGFARVQTLVRQMLADHHSAFVRRMQTEGVVLLEAELYVKWLAECRSPMTTMTVRILLPMCREPNTKIQRVQNLLQVHSPGARDPIRGMGRIAFAFASSLFHFRKDGGGIFEVTWQTPSPKDGIPTRSIVKPATSADEDRIVIYAAAIREIMSEFDDSLRAVILRHKAENGGIGMTMRACEKRLGAALASMASRAGLSAHCKGWMGYSKWALLQWADRAESATRRAS